MRGKTDYMSDEYASTYTMSMILEQLIHNGIQENRENFNFHYISHDVVVVEYNDILKNISFAKD